MLCSESFAIGAKHQLYVQNKLYLNYQPKVEHMMKYFLEYFSCGLCFIFISVGKDVTCHLSRVDWNLRQREQY